MSEKSSVTKYVSVLQVVEAARWLGPSTATTYLDPLSPVVRLAGNRVHMVEGDDALYLFVGYYGAQGYHGGSGWVRVPVGHWIVRSPGDPSDIWPVEDEYFRSKYRREQNNE